MDEKIIWQGSPSQVVNFWWFVACILVIPIPIVFWKWLVTRSTKYEITSERMKLREGVFNVKRNELELYRVRDISYEAPFFLRLFHLANLTVTTTDRSTPVVIMKAMKNSEWLKDTIRKAVEDIKTVKGVRTFDDEGGFVH